MSLAIQLPLALWCALALVEKGWGINVLRLLFFVPFMLAEVAAGLIWRFVYDGDYGLVSAVGNGLGLHPPFVLADKFWVLPAIMVVIVWKYFGFHMMIYIAGLQSIPHEVIEAARLDGVKRGQIIRHIKIPMIWSSIVVSMFFAIVGALQLFDVIIPLTNGGPNNSTHTIVTFLYQFGVRRLKIRLRRRRQRHPVHHVRRLRHRLPARTVSARGQSVSAAPRQQAPPRRASRRSSGSR